MFTVLAFVFSRGVAMHLIALVVPAALLLAPLPALQIMPPPAENPAAVQAQQRLKEGQQLLSKDSFEEAARAFQQAIELDPLLMMAHFGLGKARMALKEYPAAIAAFGAAREAYHKGAGGHEDRRVQAQNAREDRIRILEARIRDTPEQSGGIGREGGQRQALEVELQELERLREEDKRPPQPPPGLLLSLGSAFFRSGRLADAEREYRAALDAQPTLGEARTNLAVVLLITGRPAEAKEQLKLAEKSGFKPPAGLKGDIDAALARAAKKN
jgi:tetratricopeptide (TPR) repeat protein